MAGTGGGPGREPGGYSVPLIVDIPEPAQLGPKMRECTERERRFIYAITICGGDGVQAALAAGYGENSRTHEQKMGAARNASHALLTRERVLEALNEEAKKRLRSAGLIAATNLIALLNDPNLSAKDRLRANVEALDRAGLVVQQKVEVTHRDKTEASVVAKLEQLAGKLGLDPRRLIGHTLGEPVDAEFSEVVETEPFKLPPELEDIL